MEIPVNIEKYETEKFTYELNKFLELYAKYENDVNEILEFASLWRKFAPTLQKGYKYINN